MNFLEQWLLGILTESEVDDIRNLINDGHKTEIVNFGGYMYALGLVEGAMAIVAGVVSSIVVIKLIKSFLVKRKLKKHSGRYVWREENA